MTRPESSSITTRNITIFQASAVRDKYDYFKIYVLTIFVIFQATCTTEKCIHFKGWKTLFIYIYIAMV